MHDVDAVSIEREPSGQQLVADHAQREEVDAVIERASGRNFRRHVVRRAEHDAAGCQSIRGATAVAENRNAEINDARDLITASRLHDDIVWLEVAVNEAVTMSMREAVTELMNERAC